MYAAVRRFEGVRDSQKVVQVAKEGFVPLISEMPGFVAYYLVDAGDGVTVATSVFEHIRRLRSTPPLWQESSWLSI
jgi:hypothetical protein